MPKVIEKIKNDKKTAPLALSLMAMITLASAGGLSNGISNMIKEHRIAGGEYDQVKEYLLTKYENEEVFTLQEWQTLTQVVDYEIKKKDKLKLKDIKNIKDLSLKIKDNIK